MHKLCDSGSFIISENEDLWKCLFPYASTEAALNALKAGKIDCVFPVNLSAYDAAGMDVRATAPAMKTEMNAVMRDSDQQSLSRDSRISFAVHADDLKKINDTAGHKAGDQYLRDACRIICGIFKHSPVFRIGGDEFAAVIQGADYEHIEELIGKMQDHNTKALRTGGIVIACGMSKYDGDAGVALVFERADQNMYDNKTDLKTRKPE